MASEREIAFAKYWEGKEGRKLTLEVVRDAYLAGWSDRPAEAKIAKLEEALQSIIDMNVRYAIDKYSDAQQAETMACVRAARAALGQEVSRG